MYSTREKVICILYLVIGFVLLVGNNEQRLARANFIGHTAYYPLIASVSRIEEMLYLREKNRRLSEINAEQLIAINSLENRLHSLKQYINLDLEDAFHTNRVEGFTVASVISYRGSFTNRILVIDKGSDHGVELSFPVVSDSGIVGKIVSVYPKHALVLPFNNPLLKLGVVNMRTNVQGLLEADISGAVYMNMIRAGSQISVGDTVATSSVSTVFPRGFPVGTINRLLKSPEDVYLKALLNPFVTITDLEQVTVLFYRKELPDQD